MTNVNITGNETVDATSETISFASNIAVTIDGASNTISGDGGENVTVNGDNNTLTLPTPVVIAGGFSTKMIAASTATLNGQGEQLFAVKASVTVKANASVTLNGDSNSFTMASGVYQGVTGDSNTFTGTTDDTFVVQGDSNSFTLGNGADLDFIRGSNETVAASMGTIFLGSTDSGSGATTPSSATVTGSHDTINMVEASQLTLTGSNNTITGTDDSVTIHGNNDVLTIASDPNVFNPNFIGGRSGTFSLYGTGNTLNASGAVVFLSDQGVDSVTINGTGDQIDGVPNMKVEFLSTFNQEVMNDFNLSSGVIDFHGISKLNNFASVLAHATQVGTGMAANVVITAGNDTLTLNGITKSSLAAHNFSFT